MKWTFRQAAHAASLLQAVFPQALSAHLAWASLRIEDADHTHPGLRARHGDLMLSVAFRDRPGRLCVLVEQQRKVQKRMILRTAEYMVRTWQKMALPPRGGRLPLLLAILLYNGVRPWTAPLSLQDLVDAPPAGSGAGLDAASARWLALHTPHVRMHLVDLHGGQLSGLAESALTPLCRVVLGCLSMAGDDSLLDAGIARVGCALKEVLRGPEAEDALEVLLWYLAATHPGLTAVKIRTLVDNAVGPLGQEVTVSFLDEILNEGIREGKREGIREGKREGIREGKREGIRVGAREGELKAKRDALLRVMSRLGLALGKEQRARIQGCTDPAILDRWLDRAFTGKAAADVLT